VPPAEADRARRSLGRANVLAILGICFNGIGISIGLSGILGGGEGVIGTVPTGTSSSLPSLTSPSDTCAAPELEKPATYAEIGRFEVRDGDVPVVRLNELEIAVGEANRPRHARRARRGDCDRNHDHTADEAGRPEITWAVMPRWVCWCLVLARDARCAISP